MKTKRLLFAGIGFMLAGFLGAVGRDFYLSGRELFLAILPQVQIPVYLLIFSVLTLGGAILTVTFTVSQFRLSFGGVESGRKLRKDQAVKVALKKEVGNIVEKMDNSSMSDIIIGREWQAHLPSEMLSLFQRAEYELLATFYDKLDQRNTVISGLFSGYRNTSRWDEINRECKRAGLHALRDIRWDN